MKNGINKRIAILNKITTTITATIQAIIICLIIGFIFTTAIFQSELKAIGFGWLDIISGFMILTFGLYHEFMIWDTKKNGTKEEYAKYIIPFRLVSSLSIILFALSIFVYLQ